MRDSLGSTTLNTAPDSNNAGEPQFPVRIGRCIYCLATDRLTDEHIIPHSLGGMWQLLDASCEQCRIITSKIERHIAHEHFIAVRTVAGFPTYHPKKRPSTLVQPIQVRKDEDHLLKLSPGDHPAPLVFLQFEAPTFLSGLETPSIPGVVTAKVIARGAKLSKLVEKTGASGYSVPLPDRATYARFIAKVAFSYAVGAVGLESFAEVFVREAILGKANDIAKWVGCVDSEQWTTGTGEHECVGVLANGILQVGVRLLTKWHGPEYRVVVGRLHPSVSPVP